MNIKIEKGVPFSRYKKEKGVESNYPFNEMQVGDSFFLEITDEKTPHILRVKLRYAAKMFCQKHKKNWKFCTSCSENGARIWRIE